MRNLASAVTIRTHGSFPESFAASSKLRAASNASAVSRTPVADPEVEEIIRRCAREAGFEARPQQPGDIVARCLLAVVNEGARELAEGIAQRASDFDLAWINGFGFPRWRGGPLHWASRSGLDKVAGTIGGYSLSNDYWEVAPLLRQLADTGKTFADWDSEKVR